MAIPALQPEELLDLPPGGQPERNAEGEQERDDDEEADMGVPPFAEPCGAKLASCTMTPVLAVNGERIGRRRDIVSLRWLGHASHYRGSGAPGRPSRMDSPLAILPL